MRAKEWALLVVVCGLALFSFGASKKQPVKAMSADHRDSPAVVIDPAADLADVYAFQDPNIAGNVVLAMTVNPFQAPGNNQFFSPDVLYQFKIANNGTNTKEDLVIQFTFSKADGDQKFTVVGPVKPRKPGNSDTIITPKAKDVTTFNMSGLADGSILSDDSLGVKVFAGLRDDPFFFDLLYGEKVAAIIKGPPVALRTPGVDFFAGFNVSIIAIDLPAKMLTGAAGTKIKVWATTSRSSATKRSVKADPKNAPTYEQVDRMGLPTVNVVLTTPKTFTAGDPLPVGDATINGNVKDAFNRGVPNDDIKNFHDVITQGLTRLSGDAAYAATTADTVILPDTLTFDTGSSAGFPNGRAPTNDVIDAVLNIVTKGALTTDNVAANDVPFLPAFPFFAPPHAAIEGVPARDK